MQIQQQVVSHMDYNFLGKLDYAKSAYYGNFHNSTDSSKKLVKPPKAKILPMLEYLEKTKPGRKCKEKSEKKNCIKSFRFDHLPCTYIEDVRAYTMECNAPEQSKDEILFHFPCIGKIEKFEANIVFYEIRKSYVKTIAQKAHVQYSTALKVISDIFEGIFMLSPASDLSDIPHISWFIKTIKNINNLESFLVREVKNRKKFRK